MGIVLNECPPYLLAAIRADQATLRRLTEFESSFSRYDPMRRVGRFEYKAQQDIDRRAALGITVSQEEAMNKQESRFKAYQRIVANRQEAASSKMKA